MKFKSKISSSFSHLAKKSHANVTRSVPICAVFMTPRETQNMIHLSPWLPSESFSLQQAHLKSSDSREDSSLSFVSYSSWVHDVIRTLRGCIQKFPDWVDNEIITTTNTSWGATQRVMAAKLTTLTHKIATQLHVVAESCTICSSRSRWPVRKLLDTLSTNLLFPHSLPPLP
jgi:hypothetical protein